MGIKKEAATSDNLILKKDFDKEKKLIDAMVALKRENQKITFDLKKKQEECSKLTSEKLELERIVNDMNVETEKLKSDISDLKSEYAEKMNQCQITSSNLHIQNQTLSARIEQLQTTMLQKSRDENNSDGVYEVEQILDDKKIGKVMHYLIRWKGYDSSHDTWERKSNLQCPTILKQYIEKRSRN